MPFATIAVTALGISIATSVFLLFQRSISNTLYSNYGMMDSSAHDALYTTQQIDVVELRNGDHV